MSLYTEQPLPPVMADELQFITDPNGNILQIGKDISPHDAFNMLNQGYDVNIHTYRLMTTTAVRTHSEGKS